MNALDSMLIFGLATGLIISVVYSCIRGVIKEIFSLLSVSIGLLTAVRFYRIASKMINEYVKSPNLSDIIGFVIIFLSLSFFISFIGKNLRKLIQLSNLGWIDRIGGAFFGLAKGALIATVIVMMLVVTFPTGTGFLSTSKVIPYFISFSALLTLFMPEDLKGILNERRGEIVDLWKNKRTMVNELKLETSKT